MLKLKTMIRGRDNEANPHKLARTYMQDNASQIRLVLVSNLGDVQVCNRELESFTLENMAVERIFFCGADWIGFLGQRTLENGQKADDQYLEIFSQ